MEADFLKGVPLLLDLSTVAEAERAAAWRGAAPFLFPGLSVSHLDAQRPIGDIRCVHMGSGSLWAVRSPSATVRYAPAPEQIGEANGITLLMQSAGATEVRQKQRAATMAAGDMCLIDEQFPFILESNGPSEIVFLRMPRSLVLSRHPHLEHQTAMAMRGGEAGVSLLGDTLSSALLTVPFMPESRRPAALTALIHLLGTAEVAEEEQPAALPWRIRAALSFIDVNFVIAGLAAEQVAQAQRISRRRLDQLLREATGLSITSHIWKRRLEQSALDLCDPARATCTASQIAFANGFEDAAHFTRAFKRRYGHSPLQWRQLETRTGS
jgi:AraC family transcriptional activator of tynA and feaB